MLMDCVKNDVVNLGTTTTPDHEYSAMVCEVSPIAASTYKIYDDFTYGEIVISLFLFLIFMTGIFSILWFGIIKPHIHRIHKK